jgi:hypothetical protein
MTLTIDPPGTRPSSPHSPFEEAGAWALFALLWISAFVGLLIVPGGALLAALMILATCGWVLWVLLSAAGSLIKFSVATATAVIRRRQAHERRRVADSGRQSSPSFPQGQVARSEV